MVEEPNTVDASIVDLHPESTESAMSPAQAVAFTENAANDPEDSRTITAGRKRALQESTQYREADESAVLEVQDGPLQKRVKEDHEPSSVAHIVSELMSNITSSPVPAPEEVDTSHLPPSQESPVFSMLKNSSEEDQIAGAHPQPSFDPRPSSTWNAGVQSGLRTSFGGKAKVKANLQAGAANTEAESIAQSEVTSGGQSVASVASEPRRRLSRKEEAMLPKEDFVRHRREIMSSLRDKAQKEKAAKKAAKEALAPTDQSSRLHSQETVGDSGGASQFVVSTTQLAEAGVSANSRVGGQAQAPQNFAFEEFPSQAVSLLSEQERSQYWEAYFHNKNAQNVMQHPTVSSADDAELFDAADGSDSEDDEEASDLEDEDDADDAIEEAEAEATQIPSVNHGAALAIGPPPVPPPFQKVGKKKKKKMSPDERRRYRQADTAHREALKRYQLAKEAYDAMLGIVRPPRCLPPDFNENPIRLTKGEVLKLSEKDKERYAEIYEAHMMNRDRSKKNRTHKGAALVLEWLKQWPLPQSQQKTSSAIKNGRTWYATLGKRGTLRPYICKKGSFKISQVFDDNGLPIPIQEFSFNLFVPAFLMQNQGNWNAMDQAVLKGAFDHYLATYYNHALSLEPLVRSTADAPDAISLNDAIQQVYPTLQGVSRADKNDGLPGPSAGRAHFDIARQGQVEQEVILPASVVGTTGLAKEDLSQLQHGHEMMNRQERDLDAIMTGATASVQATVNTPMHTFEDIVDAELRGFLEFLQQNYYPSSSNVIRCLACAKAGHINDTCPSLSCTSCGVQGKHSTSMCPRDMPCEKCRARGHSRHNCPEKLAVPKSEMSCDLCGSRDHLETACHRIWRSFDPSPNEIIAVSGIPVHCYTCGGSDHYGPDCGLYRRSKLLTGGTTWSRSNLLRYLDPFSRNRAISARVDYSLPPKPKKNINIKGKANDPITLEDSDDDVQFLHTSVKSGNVLRGNIRIGGQGDIDVGFRRNPQGENQGFNFSGPGQLPQVPYRSGPSGEPASRNGGPNSGGKGKKASQGNAAKPKRAKERAPKKTRAARRAEMAANAGNPSGRR